VVLGNEKLIERVDGGYEVYDVMRDQAEQEPRTGDGALSRLQPALARLGAYEPAARPVAETDRTLTPEDLERLRVLGYVR
jgi:hypothetical protein